MSDKAFYQVIADELKSKTVDTALWTQAIANAEGNPDKTEAAYIRLRFIDLKKSALSQISTEMKNLQPEIKQPGNELIQLRYSLAKKLNLQGKHSLYSTLSLQPDASDEVVAMAITDLESRNQSGSGVSDAEFNYAKSTLGNPELRAQYDRRLLLSVSNDVQDMTRSYADSGMGNEYSSEESSKIPLIVGILVVALIGYFGLSYYKERNNREIQKESLETQREVANSTIDNAQAESDRKNQALRIVDERLKQDMDYRASATDRLLEQRRLEQERRAQVEQQRLKLQQDQVERQQDQAEKQRISREKQYYACLNQQLLQRGTTSDDAYARCSMYH